MSSKLEGRNTYKFCNPKDTEVILYEIIKKYGEYRFNKKGEEKRENWWYENVSDFHINLNLIFGRLLPYTNIPMEEKENKEKYLDLVIKEMQEINTEKLTDNKTLLENIQQRNEVVIFELKGQGFEIREIPGMELSWRMVIGLGASHPQETSMTLHHIYGIPYIPGSAVKGVTRHWFILKEFDALDLENFEQISCFEKILEEANLDNKDENERDDKFLEEEFKEKFKVGDTVPDNKLYNFLKMQQGTIGLYQNIFGTQNKIGKVIFFDAYPAGRINLKMDVMTPHYPQYYSDGRPPSDWQSPNPVKFLTVEKTSFNFYLSSKDVELLNQSKSYLEEALKKCGIGAKTAIGYGYFH